VLCQNSKNCKFIAPWVLNRIETHLPTDQQVQQRNTASANGKHSLVATCAFSTRHSANSGRSTSFQKTRRNSLSPKAMICVAAAQLGRVIATLSELKHGVLALAPRTWLAFPCLAFLSFAIYYALAALNALSCSEPP
jgi:hypothetical protein